ncbi:uncharacterized protein LOC141538390 [Cotesia typhae]|uniref:uncharacterized protein LOC141538390 n=1 Tax=Cotesia typhae TaxID=2053667 RepID=UPI003D689195
MTSKICVLVFFAILHGTTITYGSIIYDQIIRSNQLKQTCSTDMDCSKIHFAKCGTDGFCSCIDNFFSFNDNQCFARVNGICFENQDCFIDNSICVDEKCKCKPQYALQSYHCLPSILENFCHNHWDCQFTHNTECVNHTCVCKNNYTPVDWACLPLLGSHCLEGEPCGTPYSVCKEGKCQCQDSHIAVSNYECVPNYLGKKCDHDRDCIRIKLAQCSENKTCVCKTQKISHNYRICLNVLGENCSFDNDCASKNSMCLDNKCQCQPKYVAISDYECFLELHLEV